MVIRKRLPIDTWPKIPIRCSWCRGTENGDVRHESMEALFDHQKVHHLGRFLATCGEERREEVIEQIIRSNKKLNRWKDV